MSSKPLATDLRTPRSTESWLKTPVVLWLMVATAAGIALRFNRGLFRDLWEDEIIASTHAQFPSWQLPVEVSRLDVHPFLYFLQLHFWSLLGDGDVWLRANSMFFNVVAVGLLFLVTRRLYDLNTASIVAPLFAVSAPVIWSSQELRPYSYLYCLIICGFFATDNLFRREESSVRSVLTLIVVCLAIIYSHAIGFFFIFILGVYGATVIGQSGFKRRKMLIWLLVFGLCGVGSLPQLASDWFRDANLQAHNNIMASLVEWIPQFLLPRGDATYLLATSAILFTIVVVVGLIADQTRALAAVFIVLPLVAAAALNSIGISLFKLNVFSAMITPFFVLVLGRLLRKLGGTQQRTACAISLAALISFSTLFFVYRTPTTGYRRASQIILSAAQPGDIVYVPQIGMFWGMARYMGTKQRAWQMRVAPDLTPRWQALYARLPTWFISTFHLLPEGHLLEIAGEPSLLVGVYELQEAGLAKRVWLVTYPHNDLPPSFPPEKIGEHNLEQTMHTGFLDIRLYD